jgi:DNA-directed RNA polymerase specialized sigma24 family protein
MSYQDIASTLGISIHNVRATLHRTTKALAVRLAKWRGLMLL